MTAPIGTASAIAAMAGSSGSTMRSAIPVATPSATDVADIAARGRGERMAIPTNASATPAARIPTRVASANEVNAPMEPRVATHVATRPRAISPPGGIR